MNHISPMRTALAAAILSLAAASASASAADYSFIGSITASQATGVEGQTFSGSFSLDLPASNFTGEVLLTSFSFTFGSQAYTNTTTDAGSPASVWVDAGQFSALQYASTVNGNWVSLTTGFPDAMHGTLVHVSSGGFASEGGFQISAVPEPESYALMLGGLGIVGWIARRRLG